MALVTFEWDPALHPRDEHGRFIGKGDSAESAPTVTPSLAPDATAEQRAAAHEAIEYTHEDGQKYWPLERHVKDAIGAAWQRAHDTQLSPPSVDVDLRKMDDKLAAEVADRIDVFGQEFPAALGMVRDVRVTDADHELDYGTMAGVRQRGIEDGGGLDLRFAYQYFYYDEPLRMAVERGYEQGYHPLDTTQSVIDHELGHVLDFSLGKPSTAEKIPWGFGPAATEISGYAHKSQMEAFAEAFAIRQARGIDGLTDRFHDIADEPVKRAIRQSMQDAIGRAGGNVNFSAETTDPEWTCAGYVLDEQHTAALVVFEWDPEKHPREPAGSPDGGRFVGVEAAREPGGGATIHPRTGVQPTTGYAVAYRGHSSITPVAVFFDKPPGEETGLDIMDAWLAENATFFRTHDDAHIGIWHDDAHGEIVLDPARVIQDREEAIALGRANNQQSIADLAAIHRGDMEHAFIDTGGTGDRETGGKYTAVRGETAARDGEAPETDRRDDRHRTARVRGRAAGVDPAAGRQGDAGRLGAARVAFEFNPDEPRDERGRWVGEGGENARPEFEHSHLGAVGFLTDGKATYNGAHDLDPPAEKDWQAITADPARGAHIAADYAALPLRDQAAVASYAALRDEVAAQYDYLTNDLHVHVEAVAHDPYANVDEMVHDVAANHHLAVLSTAATGPHPFFTNEENDQFRAVHDAFGHAAIGRGFDRNGEEAAYQSHRQMFSPSAIAALTTETRGQNSALIYGPDHQFPPQKVAILPAEDLVAAGQPRADADNRYEYTRCHHTSLGRTLHHVTAAVLAYDPNQPRDDHGRWTDDGQSTSTVDTAGLEDRLAAQLGPHQPGVYYRIISDADYHRIVTSGQLDTTGTENIEIDERSGTHGGVSVSNMAPEVRYFDEGVPSRAIAVQTLPGEAQHASIYDSVLLRPVPADRIVGASDVIVRTGPDEFEVHDGTAVPAIPVRTAHHQTASALVVFEFDESKHPRDEHGRFTEAGGDGAAGSTFITRVGPDVPASTASGEWTHYALAIAAMADHDAQGVPATLAPGAYGSLRAARTDWQRTFSNSADIQRAADALLGFDPRGSVEPWAAHDARELLTAMAGHGPGEDEARTSTAPERFQPIHMQTYGPDELVRGASDPTGEIVGAFRDAQRSGEPVQWGIASFVQANRADVADQRSAVSTALGYVNAGEAPVLIRTTGQALNLDGHYEAIAGGKFAVDEIRPATLEEREAWGQGRPTGIPVETPITVVDLHQVENVRLPEGVATR